MPLVFNFVFGLAILTLGVAFLTHTKVGVGFVSDFKKFSGLNKVECRMSDNRVRNQADRDKASRVSNANLAVESALKARELQQNLRDRQEPTIVQKKGNDVLSGRIDAIQDKLEAYEERADAARERMIDQQARNKENMARSRESGK